jgi:spore coat polysaccharide biosynthesis protein SpsF (cytidylyltransferase family)
MLSDKIDYISNTLKPSFPDGTDVEVVSRQSFMRLSNFNLTSYQKEHVTPGIYQNPELFELGNLFLNYNFSNYRCTVDTLDDFTFIEKLIKASIHELERSTFFELMEILKLEISASPKTKFREAISPGPWIDYSFPYVRK